MPIEVPSRAVSMCDVHCCAAVEQLGSEHAFRVNESTHLSNELKEKASDVAYSWSKATVSEQHADVEQGTEEANATHPGNKGIEHCYSLMCMPVEGTRIQRSRDIMPDGSRINGVLEAHGVRCLKLDEMETLPKAPKTGRICQQNARRGAKVANGRRVRRKEKNAPKTRKVSYNYLAENRVGQGTSNRHLGRTQPGKVDPKKPRLIKSRNAGSSCRKRSRLHVNRRRKKLKETRNVKKHRFK